MSSSEVLGENCQESNCTTNRINLGYIPNTKYNGHRDEYKSLQRL